MSDTTLIDVSAPGWFGKLPNVGDFASRRLPDDFIERWDDWLQQGLAHARTRFGPAWLDGYLVAPIHRFWLGAGVMDDSCWAGLMMPSVDGVGRHFPLTVATRAGSLAAALSARDWYSAVDRAARRVLDMQFTIDDLEEELAHGVTPFAETADARTRALGAQLLDGLGTARVSVWWCDDADEDTAFSCFHGLPSANALASMMARAS